MVSHGENSIMMYLELMMFFGSYFDEDPQLAWAPAVVGQSAGAGRDGPHHPRPYEKALDFAERIAGEEDQFLNQAYQNLRDRKLDDVTARDSVMFEHIALVRLRLLWPEKAEQVGEEALHKLVKTSITSVPRYWLASQTGVMMYVHLMFLFGAGFDQDPQFKKIGDLLRKQDVAIRDKIDELLAVAIDSSPDTIAPPPKPAA